MENLGVTFGESRGRGWPMGRTGFQGQLANGRGMREGRPGKTTGPEKLAVLAQIGRLTVLNPVSSKKNYLKFDPCLCKGVSPKNSKPSYANISGKGQVSKMPTQQEAQNPRKSQSDKEMGKRV